MRAERRRETASVLGLKFAIGRAAHYLALADLIYGDAQALARFLSARRKQMGIIRGTFVFMRWSVASRSGPSIISSPAGVCQECRGA